MTPEEQVCIGGDAEHDHRCFQRTGVPADLPPDVCDCRIWAFLNSLPGDDA